MEFNKNWTKEDNDKMRQFIKEKKGVDFIVEYFGNEKLFYHPTKKYYYSGRPCCLPFFRKKIDDFTGFINEIKYSDLKTDFVVDWEKSKYFENEFNYIYKFRTSNYNYYIVDFIYLKDTVGPFPNTNIYNISFTLEKNRDISNYTEYEKTTKFNEHHELMKRLIFIFRNFNERFGYNSVYLLGETKNIKKINWYRNLINDSFENITEIEGESSFTDGLLGYYFTIK